MAATTSVVPEALRYAASTLADATRRVAERPAPPDPVRSRVQALKGVDAIQAAVGQLNQTTPVLLDLAADRLDAIAEQLSQNDGGRVKFALGQAVRVGRQFFAGGQSPADDARLIDEQTMCRGLVFGLTNQQNVTGLTAEVSLGAARRLIDSGRWAEALGEIGRQVPRTMTPGLAGLGQPARSVADTEVGLAFNRVLGAQQALNQAVAATQRPLRAQARYLIEAGPTLSPDHIAGLTRVNEVVHVVAQSRGRTPLLLDIPLGRTLALQEMTPPALETLVVALGGNDISAADRRRLWGPGDESVLQQAQLAGRGADNLHDAGQVLWDAARSVEAPGAQRALREIACLVVNGSQFPEFTQPLLAKAGAAAPSVEQVPDFASTVATSRAPATQQPAGPS